MTAERGRAYQLIAMLGLVSLFADITYEGARSISGPYLALLGAGSVAIGFVSGFGEWIGYGLRLFSGWMADRSKRYWLIVFAGYGINLMAVPLLGLVSSWQAAAGLLLLERFGKAIRGPARDVILSSGSEAVGHGWGFGLHEAMDQIGAVAGPLVLAALLAARFSYRFCFLSLGVAAAAAMLALVWGRLAFPNAAGDVSEAGIHPAGLPRAYWTYVVAAGLVAFGFIDYPLIAFHLKRNGLATDQWIPALYAVAMAVDALAALAFGKLYDRFGKPLVAAGPLAALAAAPLLFFGDATAILAGMVLWGASLGVQESVLRAAIADLVPRERRGSAYGLFHAVFGVCWFAGSALVGVLYAQSLLAAVTIATLAQAAAVVLLFIPVPARRP